MHIEKNVFDNIFNTVMDVKGKTKDNVKARMDLANYCRRPDLLLVNDPATGKIIQPRGNYTLSPEDAKSVYQWISELKMSDGYSSKLVRNEEPRLSCIHGVFTSHCLQQVAKTCFDTTN